MPRTISVAALQTSYGTDLQANIDKTIELVREAASRGAHVILPSELFQGPYFCVTQEEDWFATAHPWREHPCVTALAPVAKDLGVAIPVSIFERDGPPYYNSLVMLDADGEPLGVYRKSHIPDGPGYQEKYYFRPGDTGFRVWKTRFGRVGVGICWDQWYPETARAMMLISAQVNIEAAHFTPFGGEDDARRQIHGHSYLVRAWVEAEPGVEDLDRLREDLTAASLPLDHALLNEVEGLSGPSMEAVADFVAQRLAPLWPGLRKVSVARPTLGYEVIRELA